MPPIETTSNVKEFMTPCAMAPTIASDSSTTWEATLENNSHYRNTRTTNTGADRCTTLTSSTTATGVREQAAITAQSRAVSGTV